MAVKYYAVARGKQGSGIYTDWYTTEQNVTGVSGVKYKAFPTEAAACNFLLEKGVVAEDIQNFSQQPAKSVVGDVGKTTVKPVRPVVKRMLKSNNPLEDLTSAQSPALHLKAEFGTIYAYVDGSFRVGYEVYGYGVVIVSDGKVVETISGYGSRPEYVSMRNVAGEVLGAVKAMEYALNNDAKKLVLYFDYQGIESWATGAWKRNNELTRGYFEFVKGLKDKLTLSFQKVKGHSGDQFNELADELAKDAVVSSGPQD